MGVPPMGGMGVSPMRLEGFQPSRTADNGQDLPTGTSAMGEDAHATLHAETLETSLTGGKSAVQ